MVRVLVYVLGGGGVLALIAVTVFGILFYRSLNDPSASAPFHTGPVLPHETQRPLNSRFNHETTASEIVDGLDLRGKTVVITGGHSGTGLEATKALAGAGAHVIALARDVERAKANLRTVANTEIEYVDLLQPHSIDAFAKRFIASGRPLHALINSAGIMGTPLEREARGYERQFAINVLGHYQLTVRLVPALERANGARIVNLSSRGHRAGGVQFDDINFERTEYSGMKSYAQTKTALVLLTLMEDEFLKGRNIRAFAVHPGPVPTTDLFAAGKVGFSAEAQVYFSRAVASLARTFHITELLNAVRRPNNIGDLYKTVQQGGATTTWAAVHPELDGRGGLYLEDSNIAPVVPAESPAPFGVRPYALDKVAANRLWDLCAMMTGVRLEV